MYGRKHACYRIYTLNYHYIDFLGLHLFHYQQMGIINGNPHELVKIFLDDIVKLEDLTPK